MRRSNRKAWITSLLFNELLGRVNRRMKLHKRNILLFMNNVSTFLVMEVHWCWLYISNITITFLPANTTSCFQLLDAGIIQAFKLLLRSNIYNPHHGSLDSCSSGSEVSRGATVLNAVSWIDKAWKAVEPMTIRKCYHACGLPLHESYIQADSKIDEISSGVETVQDLLSIAAAAASGMEVAMDVEEYRHAY